MSRVPSPALGFLWIGEIRISSLRSRAKPNALATTRGLAKGDTFLRLVERGDSEVGEGGRDFGEREEAVRTMETGSLPDG